MARPTVSDAAETLYATLGPWARADTARGESEDRWDLLEFCEAVCRNLQPIEDIIRDSDDGPGWSVVMDIDRAPVEWFGWLAQFAGVRLIPGLPEAEQRARIKSTDGFRRGTPGAIVGAAQQYLTGTKTVFLVERHGSPYRLTVSTLANETPDLTLVQGALKDQKPAGLVMTVTTVQGGDYDSYRDSHSDYTSTAGLWTQYDELLSDPTRT